MNKPLLIIKTGTTVGGLHERRGDFENWIAEAMKQPLDQLLIARVYQGSALPDTDAIGAVVITGSASMVTDREEWSEQTAAWLVTAVNQGVPVLGICYGHQLLAHALGGIVDYHPRGREIGTVGIHFNDQSLTDPLFGLGPVCIPAHTSHAQTVVTLPESAVVLAANAFEPHHAVRYAPNCWGVQYHPEFDEEIMRAYIEARAEVLQKEGFDLERLLEEVSRADQAAQVMQAFLKVAQTASA